MVKWPTCFPKSLPARAKQKRPFSNYLEKGPAQVSRLKKEEIAPALVSFTHRHAPCCGRALAVPLRYSEDVYTLVVHWPERCLTDLSLFHISTCQSGPIEVSVRKTCLGRCDQPNCHPSGS